MQNNQQVLTALADYLTASEAAKILGADVRTVHRWIGRGKLTGIKAHGGYRAPYLIARLEVEALAASRSERLRKSA